MNRTFWKVAAAAAVGLALLDCWVSAAEKAAEQEKPKKTTADVVYVATPHDVVKKMLEMAKITKDDVVYDLGCGDGRIVVAAAKRYGCHGVGFDIADERVKESRANVKKAKVENLVEIRQEDIYTVDLSKASVITSYLLPEMNLKLIPQLDKMKAGSRIVCHDYDIGGVKADQEVHMTSNEDGVSHGIFLYTLPLKKVSTKPKAAEEEP
jgi:SAM-dependent methyltransferase